MSPDLVVWFICLAEGVCFLHRLSYTAKGKVASIKSRKFIQNSGIGAQTVVSALVIDKSDIVDREEVQIVAEVRKADGIRLNIVAAEHRRVCNGYITADRRMTERVGNEAALIVADVRRLDICCSRIAD